MSVLRISATEGGEPGGGQRGIGEGGGVKHGGGGGIGVGIAAGRGGASDGSAQGGSMEKLVESALQRHENPADQFAIVVRHTVTRGAESCFHGDGGGMVRTEGAPLPSAEAKSMTQNALR